MNLKKTATRLGGSIMLATCLTGCAVTNPNITTTFEDEKLEQQKLESEGYTRRYNTIAHECLDLERVIGAASLDYKTLDDIIDTVKSRITLRQEYNEEQAIEVLQTINDVLNYFGFSYKPTDKFNEGFKLREDEKRHLDCDTYSIAYLGVGDAIGLQLKGVLILDDKIAHIFVRWHKDDTTYFNWEATSGRIMTDKEYRKWIPPTKEDPLYLKSLSKEEFLKQHTKYFPVFRGITIKDMTLGSLDGACDLEENDLAWASLAARYEKKDPDFSIALYNKALSIKPSSFTLRGLGKLWLDKKDIDKSYYYCRKAVELDSSDYLNITTLANTIYYKEGLESSLKYYSKTNNLPLEEIISAAEINTAEISTNSREIGVKLEVLKEKEKRLNETIDKYWALKGIAEEKSCGCKFDHVILSMWQDKNSKDIIYAQGDFSYYKDGAENPDSSYKFIQQYSYNSLTGEWKFDGYKEDPVKVKPIINIELLHKLYGYSDKKTKPSNQNTYK